MSYKIKHFVIGLSLLSLLFITSPTKVSAQGRAVPTLQNWEDARVQHINFTMAYVASKKSPNHTSITSYHYKETPGDEVRIDIICSPQISEDKNARKMISQFRSNITSFYPRLSKPRVPGTPFVIPANRVKTITENLDVFAQTILAGKVKGLAKLKMDEWSSNFLYSAAFELSLWLNDTRDDKEFQNLFKSEGPWMLVFPVMSPTSMHEYMQDLELPNEQTGVLNAKRLPISMSFERDKEDLKISILKTDCDKTLVFRVDPHENVSVTLV